MGQSCSAEGRYAVERSGTGRQRALLVGVNYPGTTSALNGCINDVVAQKSVLMKQYGFGEEDIRLLVDEHVDGPVFGTPTKANILAGFKWLLEGARAGDMLFFHYSGHGTRYEDPRGELGDALVPCDYQDEEWPKRLVTDDEVHTHLYGALTQPKCKLVAIFDCCHSGQIAELNHVNRHDGTTSRAASQKKSAGGSYFQCGKPELKIRYMEPPAGAIKKSRALRPLSGGFHGAVTAGRFRDHQLWVYSGCEDDQTSADAFIDGDYSGAFTWAMVQTLQNHLFEVAHIQLVKDVRKLLTDSGYGQRPVLSTSHKPYLHYMYMPSPVMELNTAFRTLDRSLAPRKKALLVGLNYVGTPNELRGCITDMDTHKEILTKHYGFQPENMLILTEQEVEANWPYKERILEGFTWLLKDAAEGDQLFFAYSGHGSQKPDKTGKERDGKSEVLCPLDVAKGLRDENVIFDTELHYYLADLVPKGVKLTCIFDCCHSGTIENLAVKRDIGPPQRSVLAPEFYTRGRYLPWPEDSAMSPSAWSMCTGPSAPTVRRAPRDLNTEEDAHMVWEYSGCQDNQTSADAFEDGKFQGAFTWAYAKALANKRYSVQYLQLLLDIRNVLADAHYGQFPGLSTTDRRLLDFAYLGNGR